MTRSMQWFVVLPLLALLAGCATTREMSSEENERRITALNSFHDDARTAHELMWENRIDEGAELYASLWERATDPDLSDRTFESRCAASSIKSWHKKFPRLREHWQHLPSPMEARVATNEVTSDEVLQFVLLLDALDDLPPLVRQVEALKEHSERRPAWRHNRQASETAKELLVRADRRDLIRLVNRNPLQHIGDATSDVVNAIGEEISVRTLGRRMPK